MRSGHRVLTAALLVSAGAGAQTLVDLRTQSKSVDFTSANTTKPFKSGTILPAACSLGETFFKTNAPAGSNLYACTSPNAWTLLAGGAAGPQGPAGPQGAPGPTGPQGVQGPAGATGASGTQGPTGNTGSQGSAGAQGPAGVTGLQGPAGSQGPAGAAGLNGAIARIQDAGANLPVEAVLNFPGGGCADDPTNGRTNCNATGISGLSIAVNGTTQGTQSTLNFIAGTGMVQSCANNVSSSSVDCTPSYNSALIPTHDTIHANESYCASTTGTTSYTCTMPNKALTGYLAGQLFLLNPDTTCTTSCALNIDGLGAKSIKRKDGSTDPGGTLVAGQAQLLWYDGTVFRLLYQ